jgi:hypothetical protein
MKMPFESLKMRYILNDSLIEENTSASEDHVKNKVLRFHFGLYTNTSTTGFILSMPKATCPTQRAVDNWDSARFLAVSNTSAGLRFQALRASRPVATNAHRWALTTYQLQK